MTKELSTSVYKINWESLIKGALDHSNWGKDFTIYRSGDFKVILAVSSIQVRTSKVNFVVNVLSDEERGGGSFDIPWKEAHFNENLFTETLFRAVRDATDGVATSILYASKLGSLLSEEDMAIRDMRRGLYLDALETLGLTEDTVGSSVKKLLSSYVEEATATPYAVFSGFSASRKYDDCYKIDYLKGVGTTLRVKPEKVNQVGSNYGVDLDKQGLIDFAIAREKSKVEEFKATVLTEKLDKLQKQILDLKEELGN